MWHEDAFAVGAAHRGRNLAEVWWSDPYRQLGIAGAGRDEMNHAVAFGGGCESKRSGLAFDLGECVP
ncbi:MAG: hypothetical protein ACRDV3_13010, partial [Acidothermaceae bacterium]